MPRRRISGRRCARGIQHDQTKRSRRSSCTTSTPTGAPRTTSPSGRSICTTIRCSSGRWRSSDVKRMLLGHWGTTPGQNFIYAHLNRVIKKYDLDMIYISGPGHGGPAVVGNTYLEGTYSEVYPDISQDEAGLRKLFRQFSFPGRHSQPRLARVPGLDPRRRRARLLAQPCLRCGVRQPRSHRRLRGRRRRGGDGAAGHGLALEQVPQSRRRRRGAADPASQRLQDRQPDRPRAHPARRARAAAPRLRLDAVLRRGPRAGGRCTSHGRDARPGARARSSEIQRRRAPETAPRRGRAGR